VYISVASPRFLKVVVCRSDGVGRGRMGNHNYMPGVVEIHP